MEDFAAYIAKQRAELLESRKHLIASLAKIEEGIADIDREMAAIEAYERAKTGKAPTTTSSGTKRGRRGGVRETVLAAIKEAGTITRADLLIKLDAKGDKAAEQSISNALANLKKAGTITADGGNYTVAG